MKNIGYCFAFILLLLAISGCSTTDVSESSAAATPTLLTAESPKNNDMPSCVVVIIDEKKEIPITETVVFNEKDNAVAGIPTRAGGNIQLKIEGAAYDVCWGYEDLWLEKDGHAYSLWKNDLTGIVEEAANLSIEEICRYSVTANEKSAVADDSCAPVILNMLAAVHDTMPVVTDVSGNCVSFTNKLGANFDYYPASRTIYSRHMDAYLDVSGYDEELDRIIAILQ